MPALLFTFTGIPEPGQPVVSDWLDISALKSSTATKTIACTLPAGGNAESYKTLRARLMICGDAPATDPHAWSFFGPEQGGGQWTMVLAFSANLVRLAFFNVPADLATPPVCWFGYEGF